MKTRTSLALIVLAAVLSTGTTSIVEAKQPKKLTIQPKPRPHGARCYSGDQSVASGQTATLENGVTYLCNNGHWDIPLEPLR
jgi:hypothetical protein